MRGFLFWCLVGLVSGGFVGDGVGQSAKPCSYCKHVGYMPCKQHKKAERSWEAGALHCSAVGACGQCQGTLQIDCQRCDRPAQEGSAEKRRAALLKWRAGLRQSVDAFTRSKGILHARSKHFDLTFSLAPMQVGKVRKKRSTHELMHIYLNFLEELYADFSKTLGLVEGDFEVRAEIFMFEKRKDHAEIVPKKVGGDAGLATGKKFMGDKMIFSMWRQPNELRSDDDLRRYLAHHVTHLFVNHFAPMTWIYNKGHGWLDAGLAHYFEMKYSGICTNACNEEVEAGFSGGYKSGHWRVAVRKLMTNRKRMKFADLYQQNTDQLNSEAHALSMAYVEFLLENYKGSQLRDLVRAAKEKQPTRAAMKRIYGLTPISIEKPFEKWVLRKYPRRARSRKE